MRRCRTVVVLGAAVACLTALVAPAAAVPAQSTGPAPGSVSDLEQRLVAAQEASSAAVARFQEGTAKHEALVDEIAAVERRIAAGRERAAVLRAVVRDRAVAAYKGRERATDVATAMFSGDSLLQEMRRATFLERANARDEIALGQLRVLDEDLAVQKSDLARKRDEAARIVAQLDAERARLASAVAEARRAYDELVDRLAREAESRAAAERAARQALVAARPPTVVSGTPVAGFLCPLRGSFTNDFGDPRSGGRSHAGIDIFAPTGAPVVAVKSGSLVLEQGGAGGNAAYLHASDGNTYYYAHFSSYAGGGREVSQGEVIGYVGQTGSATAPHLHFEIRTSAGAVNPYATLVASC